MGAPTNVLSRSATGTSQLPDSSAVPSDSSVPSDNPATVTVSPPEPSATEMPSGSGSLVMPFWFSIARCAGEPNGFIRPKLSTDFRIGSGKANSAIPIMPITTAMTLIANSLPSLTLTELRSIAHDLYCSVRDGGRMMSGFSLFGSRTSSKGGVLSAVAGGSMLKPPSPRAIGRAAIWASDSSAQAGSAC